jgi:activating signal cointegrator 1
MEVKGLSLTQPWASFVAVGAKRWETRTWRTDYRGLVLIHASARWPATARQECVDNPVFSRILIAGGIDPDRCVEAKSAGTSIQPLPCGRVIAVARIVTCVPTKDVRKKLSKQERALGNFENGRWAWRLADIEELKTAIPYKGSLGLWTPHPELLREVNRQTGGRLVR